MEEVLPVEVLESKSFWLDLIESQGLDVAQNICNKIEKSKPTSEAAIVCGFIVGNEIAKRDKTRFNEKVNREKAQFRLARDAFYISILAIICSFAVPFLLR